MHILSVHLGFAPDHSTTTYRYTAPDKATAWRAFWEGLPAVCAAGQGYNAKLWVNPAAPAGLSNPAVQRAEPGEPGRFWLAKSRFPSQRGLDGSVMLTTGLAIQAEQGE